MDEKNIYIEILKLGVKKGLEGVTMVDIFEELKRKKRITNDEFNILKQYEESGRAGPHQALFHKIESIVVEVFHLRGSMYGEYVLKFDGAFKLIDFLELKDARENAKEAKKHSLFAIILSIVAITLSVAFGGLGIYASYELTKWQVESPIQIEPTQFDQIENLKLEMESVNKKLDKLIQEQEKVEDMGK